MDEVKNSVYFKASLDVGIDSAARACVVGRHFRLTRSTALPQTLR